MELRGEIDKSTITTGDDRMTELLDRNNKGYRRTQQYHQPIGSNEYA